MGTELKDSENFPERSKLTEGDIEAAKLRVERETLRLENHRFKLALVATAATAIAAIVGAVYQWNERSIEKRLLQAQSVELKNEIADLRKEKANVYADLSTKQIELGELKEKVAEEQRRLVDLQSATAAETLAPRIKLAELNEKIKESEDRIEELQYQISQLDSIIASEPYNDPAAYKAIKDKMEAAIKQRIDVEHVLKTVWNDKTPIDSIEAHDTSVDIRGHRLSSTSYSVIIDGKEYSVGQSYNGANIKSISFSGVTFERQGIEYTAINPILLKPIDIDKFRK